MSFTILDPGEIAVNPGSLSPGSTHPSREDKQSQVFSVCFLRVRLGTCQELWEQQEGGSSLEHQRECPRGSNRKVEA